MAFKLTKEETAKRDDHVEKLEQAWGEIQEAINKYNEALAELRKPIETAIVKYNEALGEAKEFAERVANRLDSEFDEKSEKWQEGDKGQAAAEFRDAWTLDMEELEVEWPDDLEINDPDYGPELAELPAEAE